MVRYFYAWTPIAIVFATAALLTIPYLALVALAIVALLALAALAWAIFSVPYRLGRALAHRLTGRIDASPQAAPAPALSPATHSSA